MTTTETRRTTDHGDLLQVRRETIEESGWGARFTLVQPRNACFWLLLVMTVVGMYSWASMALPTAGLFAQANIAAAVTSGLFGVAYLVFLRFADRWERTPPLLAVVAFLGGGFAAAYAIAIVGNAAMMSLYAKTFGQPFAVDWKAGLTAPFVEETAKGAVFILLLGLAPVVIRTVYDGLIVGAYVGLGFQIIEDVLYGQQSAAAAFGAGQVSSVLDTFALRAVTGVASHALYTAVFAAGIIYVVGTPAQPRRAGRGVVFMLIAMVIHGVWDSAGAIAGAFSIVLMAFLTIAAVVALYVVVRSGGGREREIMSAILAPEVADGTLRSSDLDSVVGDRKVRRALLKHPPEGMTARSQKGVAAASRNLAHDLARSTGDDTPEVQHAREEIARLRAAG